MEQSEFHIASYYFLYLCEEGTDKKGVTEVTEMKGSKYTRLSLSPQPNSFDYLAQTQYVTLDSLELAISLL